MIKVRIVSGFIADEIAMNFPLGEIDLVESYMNIEGKEPGEVFDAMIALGIDWEIEYGEATDEECEKWALIDIASRQVRAEQMGKTLIIDGEPVSHGEFQEKLFAFMHKSGFIPDVIADNSQSYILGIEE